MQLSGGPWRTNCGYCWEAEDGSGRPPRKPGSDARPWPQSQQSRGRPRLLPLRTQHGSGSVARGKPAWRGLTENAFPEISPDLRAFKIWGMVLGWKPSQISKTFGPCLSCASFSGLVLKINCALSFRAPRIPECDSVLPGAAKTHPRSPFPSGRPWHVSVFTLCFFCLVVAFSGLQVSPPGMETSLVPEGSLPCP